jgi:NitT/TauT family transport system permease protein
MLKIKQFAISPKLPQAKPIIKSTVFWRIAEEIPHSWRWVFMIASISIPLLLWGVISNLGIVQSLFLPTPSQVGAAILQMVSNGDLLTDISYSCFRVFCGFIIAAIISIPLGILMGTFASIRALLEPIVGIVRYMPAPAFIPLLVLYFGVGEIPKILLIFLGTLFFNTLMIMDAVKFVPKELIEISYTLGGKRRQILLQVIFPYVLPKIIDACRVNIAASWNLVIVAELVAATEGLGRRISVAQRFLHTDQIFAGLIIIGLIGLVIDLLFRWLLHISCRWSID